MAKPIRIGYSVTNRLFLEARTRFSDENMQLIARARCGAFGGVYNPGNTKSVARALKHNGDHYRAHIRGLTDRKADSWTTIPPEFIDKSDFKDKLITKKINALLKANNTYQTPKK